MKLFGAGEIRSEPSTFRSITEEKKKKEKKKAFLVIHQGRLQGQEFGSGFNPVTVSSPLHQPAEARVLGFFQRVVTRHSVIPWDFNPTEQIRLSVRRVQ